MKSKGYLFISNSSKPTDEQRADRAPVRLNFFSTPCIEAARDMGYELHMGTNREKPEKLTAEGYDIKFYDSHTYRNIFAIKDNWIAYKNTCSYLYNHPDIEVVHCNTPIGGVIGRLCGKKFGCKVIYTAHGFHFYKGAPLFNRTILKWIEKWLAHYTDAIITINQEDFEAAQKFKLKRDGKVFKVPGVGVSTDRYTPIKDKEQIFHELGIPKGSFVCISLGDLVPNKNYVTLINAWKDLKQTKAVLLICGRGVQAEYLSQLIKETGIENQVKLLGFRTDVKDLLGIADAFILSSKREGLPRSTMEAMAAGLPCIVSDIRGNRDLIEDGKGGFLIPPNESEGFARAIENLMAHPNKVKMMSNWNQTKIKDFDVDIVRQHLKDIYHEILDNKVEIQNY